MRLSRREINIIKERIHKVFGDATVYLFGSRVDDAKRGGDIDLYIIPKLPNRLFTKKLRLKTELEDLLYKPVDIVVATNQERLIEQEARRGIEI